MARQRSAMVVGGTSGIGREIAKVLAERGEEVVITGRDQTRAQAVAAELGARIRGLGLDLVRPAEIAGRLGRIGQVDHLVLAAIERDDNSVRKYDIGRAMQLVTLKLVGYTEVVHALAPHLAADASIVLFGGVANERPYPGSTTVTSVNGAVTGMIRTLAVELAPVRVNAIHPGIVGDSPFWNGKPAAALERIRARTPTGRLATMGDIADAVVFLLHNPSVNGINLAVDGGWLLL